MPPISSQDKSVRADARRNRERLLRAARDAFTSGEGTVSLEGVARAAGVGIGTLYRHFPTREDLVDAVYRAEFDTLRDDLDRIQATEPLPDALRSVMTRLADYLTTKRELVDAMRTAREGSQMSLAEKQAILIGKIDELLAASDELRDDVPGEDVFTSVIGILSACPLPDKRAQADRLLDLLFDGLHRR